jgi:hypothetical protein
MWHLSRSRSMTLLRRMNDSRLCLQYRLGKTRKKLNRCQENDNHVQREDGNKAESEEDEDYTPWSNVEKDEKFHDADKIKTFRDEVPIPTGKLRDLLNHINITTLPEFRIKRIPCPGREEYKAIMEIISGPNVLSREKGPAFRTTYQDAIADAAWQEITTYSHRYYDELRNTI